MFIHGRDMASPPWLAKGGRRCSGKTPALLHYVLQSCGTVQDSAILPHTPLCHPVKSC
jgi:hypothetical protein